MDQWMSGLMEEERPGAFFGHQSNNPQIQQSISVPFDGSQMGWVTACLLHNESASYCQWRISLSPSGTEAKGNRVRNVRNEVAGNRPEAEVIYF